MQPIPRPPAHRHIPSLHQSVCLQKKNGKAARQAVKTDPILIRIAPCRLKRVTAGLVDV